MLPLQEISDRLEIDELLVRYSHVIDSGSWEEFADVFTEDAVIDYTEMGGPRGGVGETLRFLQAAMPHFLSYQHLVSNTVLHIDGDTATARSICHNPMVLDRGEGRTHVFFCGLWYRDTLVRTARGWRIRERYEERSYVHNAPDELAQPTDAP
ncbi:MAG TPA: nuclear transport factor 2 family protein [Acidimicrobiales bacterium]|nr:nuclear transport factor 2 family protein [Acidimicrobiales bacterium]